MSSFNYTAIKTDGEKYSATLEAPDKFVLYRELKAKGETVLHVEESGEKGATLTQKVVHYINGLIGGVSTHEKIIFARNLGAMISAGLSLSKALTVLEKQTRNETFKKIIVNLNDSISQGKTLSESMKDYPKVFSDLFTAMVKAGEESGGLAESLRVVALQMDNSYRLTQKIRGAMIYPAVIICVIVVIAILMFIFVLPGITGTFKEMNVTLPLSTRLIIGLSDFMKDNMVLTFAILLAFIAILVSIYKNKKGKIMIDAVLLKVPFIGQLIKETNSARTSRTLSSLISAGVPISDALKITGEVLQNHFYKEVLNEAYENIGKGVTISSIFMKHEKLYPIFVGEMMNVGEETGKTPDMLLGVATYYENEVEQKTKDMSTIIEPVLMVVIGAAVGFFAIAMITPIYSLMDTI